MKWFLLLLTTAAAVHCPISVEAGAPERQWQTGTCTDAGLMRDLTVGQGTAGARSPRQ